MRAEGHATGGRLNRCARDQVRIPELQGCVTSRRGVPTDAVFARFSPATVLRMRANDVLLTLHILASATWIGAALALQVIAGRIRPSTPDAVVAELAVDAEAIGKALFGPSAIVLLVTGAALVEREQRRPHRD